MKLKLVVLSALAGVAVLCAAGPIISEPKSTFHEIGRVSTGSVLIDLTSLQVDRDPAGMPIAAMIVKIKYRKPLAKAMSLDRATVFSCRERSALVVASTTYDEKEVMLGSNEDRKIVPWVNGKDGDQAVNLIMTKLCAGYKPPLAKGLREA